ncbi:MAG TPA: TonB-dependent receptor [Gemmatimonadales bacterium]|nr:TonB-dependent receptor [Gemmatimonadales bacterium]
MLAIILSILIVPADTVTGRVVDNAAQPIAAAIVEVPALGRSATTGADGTFRLVLAPGRYTLAVHRQGYAPVVREISVDGSQSSVEIALTSSPFRLEPISVTAARQPVAAQGSSLPATALASDELRRAQGVSLAHVADVLPGVEAITTGAQIGKPVIRGFAGPRVLTLDNGSRLEDYSWSDEDGPSVETAFLERVELIRGPASVLYGSDALGGVLNAIPGALPDAGGGPGFTRTGFLLSAATNNLEFSAGAAAEGAKGTFGWRAAAIGRGSGNLHTPQEELDNTGFGALNGEAAGGWRWSSGSSLAMRVVHYGGEFKLLEANAPPGEQGGPERKAGDDRFQINAQHPVGSWRLEAKGQLQRHSLIEMADDSTGTESEAFNLQLKTGALDLLAHHNGLTLGATAMGQTSDASGREPIVPDATTISSAAFAFGQWHLGGSTGRWSVLAGARADARRLSADPDSALGTVAQDQTSSAWSGNLGLVFAPAASWTLSVNLGRAWRAPTLFELFANGPHIGEARYELGDSTLDPESNRALDVGVRWQSAKTRFELSGYHNRISHFIYVAPTALVIDSLPVYQYTQAEAELYGGEASLETAVGTGLIVHGRAAVVRATNLEAHEPLPLIPPLNGTVGLSYRHQAGVELESHATPKHLNPLDIPTNGYTLVNLWGGGDVRMLGRVVRVDVSIRNAFNKRYRSFLSRYKTFADDPGRNVIFRFSTGIVGD